MVLFGNEFDADERAEVGGGLRGGEGDHDLGGRDGALFDFNAMEDDGHDRVRAQGAVDSAHQVCDFVSSH